METIKNLFNGMIACAKALVKAVWDKLMGLLNRKAV